MRKRKIKQWSLKKLRPSERPKRNGIGLVDRSYFLAKARLLTSGWLSWQVNGSIERSREWPELGGQEVRLRRVKVSSGREKSEMGGRRERENKGKNDYFMLKS